MFQRFTCHAPARILFAILALIAMTMTSGAQAQLSGTGPFIGSLTEDWESFANYLVHPTFYLSDPTSIMGGGATISNPLMAVYQPGSASFGLGTSGLASVSDGVKAMGIDSYAQTTTIVFSSLVNAFGAYWGAATGFGFPDPNTVEVSFFDASDNLIDVAQTFTYSKSSDGSGALDWHGWTSTVGIKKVVYKGDYVVIDGLQANIAMAPVPEGGTLASLGLFLGLGAFGLRRRLRK